jgi:uncharacterized damage-inducible protein DinB
MAPAVTGRDAAIRDHLARLLDWEEARVGFDAAVADVPARMRGTQPPGLPHSLWQLVEHIRITQHDILDFCRNKNYEEMTWPDDYWPASAAPPSDAAWKKSLSRVRADRKALQQLARRASIDLTQRIPHGSGQTWLRELLLAADHAAYHVGQIVLVRQLLGIWRGK